MRIALLSALADLPGTSGGSPGERPAFRRFAGKTVLAHQIDCAAHLGCERALCLVAATGPDLAAVKGHAERSGLRFEAIDSKLRLQAQVTAHDEVILIEDGVLPDRGVLVENLADRPAVLAFPEDPALALGFERLDATRAWSGALRIRGESVARLAELPADCDLPSALLRIALQSGARVVELDPAPLTDGTWQRRVGRQANQDTEWRWVARQVRLAPFAAPGRALAERMGLRWAQDASGGRHARLPGGLALAAGVSAAVTGFLGWPVLGMALLLLASIALAVASIFERVDALGTARRKSGRVMAAAELVRDGLLVALLSLQIMVVPSWLGLLLPLVLVGLLWFAETIAGERLRALCSDRIMLLFGLVPLAYLGWSTIALGALIAAVLAALVWTVRRPSVALTAD